MSNTPKEQTAVINRLHITTPTNSYGIGSPKNPYTDATYDRTEAINFHEFRESYPDLPVIDHLTGDLKSGWIGEVTGPCSAWYCEEKNQIALDLDTHFSKGLSHWSPVSVYLTLADDQPAHLNQPPTEDNCPTCKQDTNVYCSNAYHLGKLLTENKQQGEMVSLAAVIELVKNYPRMRPSSTQDLLNQIRNLTIK